MVLNVVGVVGVIIGLDVQKEARGDQHQRRQRRHDHRNVVRDALARRREASDAEETEGAYDAQEADEPDKLEELSVAAAAEGVLDPLVVRDVHHQLQHRRHDGQQVGERHGREEPRLLVARKVELEEVVGEEEGDEHDLQPLVEARIVHDAVVVVRRGDVRYARAERDACLEDLPHEAVARMDEEEGVELRTV